jgi:hypothetical protein
MKKFFITLLAVASVVGVMAQQETDKANPAPYKLEKGSITTELNFSPFSINVNYDDESFTTGAFTMPALRLRYALSNKLALRANIGLDYGHNKIKENLDDTYDEYWQRWVTTGDYINKRNYTNFSFAPGIEYHFGKWERLSFYVGGELLFGFKITHNNVDLNSKTSVYNMDYMGEPHLMQEMTTVSTLQTKNCTYTYGPWGAHYTRTGKMFFGINALTGFDVYVYKGLYLGAELGLGYTYSLALKGTVKGEETTTTWNAHSDETNTNTSEIDELFNDKITDGRFNFKCNPMIRLGWRF